MSLIARHRIARPTPIQLKTRPRFCPVGLTFPMDLLKVFRMAELPVPWEKCRKGGLRHQSDQLKSDCLQSIYMSCLWERPWLLLMSMEPKQTGSCVQIHQSMRALTGSLRYHSCWLRLQSKSSHLTDLSLLRWVPWPTTECNLSKERLWKVNSPPPAPFPPPPPLPLLHPRVSVLARSTSNTWSSCVVLAGVAATIHRKI